VASEAGGLSKGTEKRARHERKVKERIFFLGKGKGRRRRRRRRRRDKKRRR
jgi:hypothetical protein